MSHLVIPCANRSHVAKFQRFTQRRFCLFKTMGSSHWFFGRDRSAGILLKMRSNSQKNPLYLGYLPLFAGLRSCFDPLALFIKQPWIQLGSFGLVFHRVLWGSGVVGSLRPERCTVFVASAMDFMPGSCHWKFAGGPTMPNPHAKTM